MRRTALILALLLAILPASAGAQSFPYTNGNAIAIYTPTVAETPATAPDSGIVIPAAAGEAWVYVETQDVRIRFDGGTPTASVGLVLKAGTLYIFSGLDLTKWRGSKFIEAVAGAKMTVQYFKNNPT